MKMMKISSLNTSSSGVLHKILLLLCFLMFLSPAATLIVPQELPSILSLVYSNIPPIKKGTDSRVGFGFRLGEHADFQVLMELGPQKETKPIGDQDNNNSFNKRQVNKEEEFAQLRKQMRLKLQQLQEEKEKREKTSKDQDGVQSNDKSALSWLENWSQSTNEEKLSKTNLSSKKEQLKKQNPTMPTLNEQSLKQLQLLYKLATTEQSIIQPKPYKYKSESDTKNKQKITKELMDVRLADGE